MSERLIDKLSAAQRSPEYTEAIFEDIVEMVAQVAGRGGAIPAVASTGSKAISFPDWLRRQMDDYAAARADLAAEQLREAVEDAFRDGFRAGYLSDDFSDAGVCWEESESLTKLEARARGERETDQ